MCAFTTETLFRTRHWHTSARSPTRSGTSKDISVAFPRSTISLCVLVSFTPSPRAKTRLTRRSVSRVGSEPPPPPSPPGGSDASPPPSFPVSDLASTSDSAPSRFSPSSSAFFRSTWYVSPLFSRPSPARTAGTSPSPSPSPSGDGPVPGRGAFTGDGSGDRDGSRDPAEVSTTSRTSSANLRGFAIFPPSLCWTRKISDAIPDVGEVVTSASTTLCALRWKNALRSRSRRGRSCALTFTTVHVALSLLDTSTPAHCRGITPHCVMRVLWKSEELSGVSAPVASSIASNDGAIAAAAVSFPPDPRSAREPIGASSAREARAGACHSRPRVESRGRKAANVARTESTRMWLEHARARVAPASPASSEIQTPSSRLRAAPLLDSTTRVCGCPSRSASQCRAR